MDSLHLGRSLFKALPLLVLAGTAHAVDRNAATCSFADVVTAYNAAVDGDRVVIPAGSCTWNSQLTWAKGIEITGVSASSPTLTGPRFLVTVPAGKAWTLSNMAITGTGGVNVTGFSKSGRIHHIGFSEITGFYDNRVIYLTPACGGYSTGVIDHNTFATPHSIQIHVREDCDHGNYSWMRPLDLGGPDAWYIEDNNFSQCTTNPCTGGGGYPQYEVSVPMTDCDGGGRFVFRNNTVRSNYTEMHDAIVSGTRGCRKWEVYSNTWTTSQTEYNNTSAFTFMGFRGGNGVVFNNTFTADAFGFEMVIGNYRAGGQTAGDPWANSCQTSGSNKACLNRASAGALTTCTNDSQCGGVTGACVKIDGPGGSGLPTNYPCRDQLGTLGNSTQKLLPALFWNNRRGSTQIAPTLAGFFDSLYTVEGRDYCVGPTTSAADNATKPTSCGAKQTPYTQYTYPHPLTTGLNAPKPPGG